MKLTLYLAQLLIIYFLSSICEKVTYEKQQIWLVPGYSKDDVAVLKTMTRDPTLIVEHSSFFEDRSGQLFLRITKDDVDRVKSLLKSSSLKYDVVVNDVQELLDLMHIENEVRIKRSTGKLENFDYEVYHPLDEIEEWMELLDKEYDFVDKFKIGSSTEGRILSGISISKNPDQNNPVFYMDAATHAREWISPATLMYICNQILTNDAYSELLNNLDFYLVPVVNIDGYNYTWAKDRLWRKTRTVHDDRFNGRLCVGVDANRNWNVSFLGRGSSNHPCSIFYRGPRPHSEPVIEHLAKFIESKKDRIKAVISFHNWGQQILHPYNADPNRTPPNEEELITVSMDMTDAIKAVNGSEYQWGRGAKVLYVFSGSTSDWTYEKAGIDLSFTIELRDTGTFGFILSPDQIKPTGLEMVAAVEVLGKKVIEKCLNNNCL